MKDTKKTFLALLGIVILGGVGFMFSQSDLLKGALETRSPLNELSFPTEVGSFQTSVDSLFGNIEDLTANQAASRAANQESVAETKMNSAKTSLEEAVAAFDAHDQGSLSDAQSAAESAADAAERSADWADQYADQAETELERLLNAMERELESTCRYEECSEPTYSSDGTAMISCTYQYDTDDSEYAECVDWLDGQYEVEWGSFSEDFMGYDYMAAREQYEEAIVYASAARDSADQAETHAAAALDYSNAANALTLLSCSSLTVTPRSHEMQAEDSSADFDFEVRLTTARASGSSGFLPKMLQAFILVETETTVEIEGAINAHVVQEAWNGNLVIETDGDGTFTLGTLSGNPIALELSEEGSMTVSFSGGQDGDVINVYIEGEETPCSDQIIISQDTSSLDNDGDELTNDEQKEDQTGTGEDDESDAVTSDGEDYDYSDAEILASKDYVCSDPFTDTHGQWHEDLICRMYNTSIVIGRSSTLFEPNEEMTRAEWIKVLVLIFGYDEDDANGKTESFADVSSGDWFYPYIVIAGEDVIRPSQENSYFNPNVPITRADAVLYAVRMADLTSYSYDVEDDFSDVDNSDYFAYALSLMTETLVDVATTQSDGSVTVEYDVALIEGYSNGTFKPYNYIVRSEAMAIAMRVAIAWGIASDY